MTHAEDAVARIARRDYVGAAHETRLALDGAPDDPTLSVLAGAILLQTGDDKHAQEAFSLATQQGGTDGLAFYGFGLAQFAQRKGDKALENWSRSEQAGGDMTALLIARRYAQFLTGAQVSLDEAGVTASGLAAQKALAGMAAWRRKDYVVATAALETAQSSLPGDPLQQPSGLLMTFASARPLETEENALPGAAALNAPPLGGALEGNLLIQPQNAQPGVSYVSYSCDGQALGLINVPPFQYVWDTRQVANGWHTLTIQCCDADGREITHTTRQMRIMNRGALRKSTEEAERWTRLRLALWQNLTLRPDRGACAYALGAIYRMQGKIETAQIWFARAAAARPDYGDVHAQLAACGGIGTPGATLWKGPAGEKVVALTFDDGPTPGVTDSLLGVLQKEHVPATFFVIGRHVSEYPELTRRISDAGMELANHSYTHRNLTRLTSEEVASEMLQTQAAIEVATGKKARFLRPPGGNWNTNVARIVRAWGLTPCMWTVDAYSSEVLGPQQVANLVLRQVRPGAIILMHNGTLNTLQALPSIIQELRRRGYAFATVDTLMQHIQAARANGRQALNEAVARHSE